MSTRVRPGVEKPGRRARPGQATGSAISIGQAADTGHGQSAPAGYRRTSDVVELSVERLVRLDERIDSHEGEALRDRWEFGHELLSARDGKGRLPNGYLTDLTRRTGKSRGELSRRARFAERFPTEDELCHAVTRFGSWHQVVKVALANEPEPVAAEPTPAPEGTFGTIVADPPWRYGNTSTRNAAANHYPTMSIEELCALDVAREKAAAQSHLYLWTTSSHLPDAFTVMAAWGFTYKTYLVWVKEQIGMGNYFRVSTELVLFGVKGGLRTRNRSLRNHFTAPRSKHSAKPLKFHEDTVMAASPGPYLELFARCHADPVLDDACTCSKCRLGWTTWGDQS